MKTIFKTVEANSVQEFDEKCNALSSIGWIPSPSFFVFEGSKNFHFYQQFAKQVKLDGKDTNK